MLLICAVRVETRDSRVRVEKREAENYESAVNNCCRRGLFIGAGRAMASQLLILPNTRLMSHSQVPNILFKSRSRTLLEFVVKFVCN